MASASSTRFAGAGPRTRAWFWRGWLFLGCFRSTWQARNRSFAAGLRKHSVSSCPAAGFWPWSWCWCLRYCTVSRTGVFAFPCDVVLSLGLSARTLMDGRIELAVGVHAANNINYVLGRIFSLPSHALIVFDDSVTPRYARRPRRGPIGNRLRHISLSPARRRAHAQPTVLLSTVTPVDDLPSRLVSATFRRYSLFRFRIIPLIPFIPNRLPHPHFLRLYRTQRCVSSEGAEQSTLAPLVAGGGSRFFDDARVAPAPAITLGRRPSGL